ncbi:MAG TPA: PDZ domain-containing protein [Gemmataceae bacterium]
MSRFMLLAPFAAAVGWLTAAPVPPTAKELVARLSSPSATVRDDAAADLRGRVDALPWLRRAARSADADTARRAAALLIAPGAKRQATAARAIDACIKSGQVDLFMEWHHFWQPENKDDLWSVGPRMVQRAREHWATWCPPEREKGLARIKLVLDTDMPPDRNLRSYDGPWAGLSWKGRSATWNIRTDTWLSMTSFHYLNFASVAGPTHIRGPAGPGRFFVLGPIQINDRQHSGTFAVCDREFYNGCSIWEGLQKWHDTINSFVVCRGNFSGGRGVLSSVLLVDGDVELFDGSDKTIKDSVIRASGEIRIPKNVRVINSTIEPHAKNATAPYKFFELADAGLSLADDEEGLVVTGVKAGTPFGVSAIAKGDIVQAIDDEPPGDSEQFRKLVRRALVRQGDCLLTVARGNKVLDLPVFFPLPK